MRQMPTKRFALCALAVALLVWAASEPGLGGSQQPAGQKNENAMPRIARVSPPEAKGAVEVSVAINPTRPDHMVAVSIAKMGKHPGITDFAYVTDDAGRTWKAVP